MGLACGSADSAGTGSANLGAVSYSSSPEPRRRRWGQDSTGRSLKRRKPPIRSMPAKSEASSKGSIQDLPKLSEAKASDRCLRQAHVSGALTLPGLLERGLKASLQKLHPERSLLPSIRGGLGSGKLEVAKDTLRYTLLRDHAALSINAKPRKLMS